VRAFRMGGGVHHNTVLGRNMGLRFARSNAVIRSCRRYRRIRGRAF
jgi:hypothetical protein